MGKTGKLMNQFGEETMRMKPSDKYILDFIALTKQDLGFDAQNKAKFLRNGKRIMLAIAERLEGLKEYNIGINKGGEAVSGEVILHTEWLYVQFSQFCGMKQFLYRNCNGLKDYSGGRNMWMDWEALLDLDHVCKIFNTLKPKA